MTVQDTIAHSKTAETLRAKGAEVADNYIEPAKENLTEAANKAKETAAEMASTLRQRAGEISEAAVERGSALASDLSQTASRNVAAAGSGIRDFARRNPEMLIAGAALVGIGLAAWLRNSTSDTDA